MKKDKKWAIIIIALVIVILLIHKTSSEKELLPMRERLPNIKEEYYSHILLTSRREGGCDVLIGTIKPIIIFVNDTAGQWSEIEKQESRKLCMDAINDIIQDAQLYGRVLTINPEFITATTVEYYQTEENDAWMDEVFDSAGLPENGIVNDALEQKYGVDEAPLVFLTKQSGRAHANNILGTEYVMMYDDLSASAFRHELYHLYGAKDYYYPDDVKNVAKDMFAESIMLEDNGKVDALSAYILGWTDIPSEIAMKFIEKTSHVTTDDVVESLEKEWYTGYTTDWVTAWGVYTGYVKDGCFDGQGTCVFTDGTRYDGGWKNGLEEGYGTCYYYNGDIYEGDWKKGLEEGYGTYYYYNGDVYEGHWENGCREGYGKYIFKDGTTMSGYWSNNEYNG